MRFSMMWPSGFTYIRYRMLSATGIGLQHIALLVEGDLPRDRLISLIYIFHSIN